MPLFPADALNPGVRPREVFGWALYDFANSGYTTVVLTAVFAASFVGAVAGGESWASGWPSNSCGRNRIWNAASTCRVLTSSSPVCSMA